MTNPKPPRNGAADTTAFDQWVKDTLPQYTSIRKMADATGVTRDCLSKAVKRTAEAFEKAAAPEVPIGAELPASDLPTPQIIDMMKRRFTQRHEHHKAKRWREFAVPTDGPYALMFFGDPHVDDNGCNWPLLTAHCDLARDTEALYAINIGDATNNWTGRMARLWAEQDTSASTARSLAKWLLGESGVPWFLWLHGNHDLWDGPVSATWFEAVRPHFVAMEDWSAKVTLKSPNGYALRLWASHNFKGNSMWNPLHGNLRAAQMEDWAHLYVAGHHHDCGIFQQPNPHRNFVANGLRVRGYKFMDHYADLHQFGNYQDGASGLAVIDPAADKPNAVQCFLDPFEGTEFLKWKRRKL